MGNLLLDLFDRYMGKASDESQYDPNAPIKEPVSQDIKKLMKYHGTRTLDPTNDPYVSTFQRGGQTVKVAMPRDSAPKEYYSDLNPPRYLGTSGTRMTSEELVANKNKSGKDRLMEFVQGLVGGAYAGQ
jgi:hypothetical protein